MLALHLPKNHNSLLSTKLIEDLAWFGSLVYTFPTSLGHYIYMYIYILSSKFL